MVRSLLFRSSRIVLLEAVAIAVRVAHKLNDPSFVRAPVEKGRGHFGIGKNLIPVAKAQITGNVNPRILRAESV